MDTIKLSGPVNGGHFEGTITCPSPSEPTKDMTFKFGARFDLWLIRQAWEAGIDMEDLADGFGPGFGTHGDWSAIRDSSEEALRLMTERALNAVTFKR